MIANLYRALVDAGVELDWQDVADIIWLHLAMREEGEQSSAPSLSTNSAPVEPQAIPEPPPPELMESDRHLLQSTTASEWRTFDVSATGSPAVLELDAVNSSAAELAALSAPRRIDLPRRRDFERAIRPLRVRRRTANRRELDTIATVDHAAETGILAPILRSAPEPWFDLDLVVEASPTMSIWRETANSLAQLLEQSGVFRRVTRWHLTASDDGMALTSKSRSPTRPLLLADKSHRQVILVLSDGLSELWNSPRIWSVLREWGTRSPTAIIQVLRARRTGLSQIGVPTTKVRSHSPAAPNARLRTDAAWSSDGPGRDVIPVLSLDAADWGAYSRVLLGKPSARVNAIRTAAPAQRQRPSFDSLSRSELQSVLNTALSPTARKLGSLLSAADASLEAAHIVMSRLLPSANIADLGELLAYGVVTAERNRLQFDHAVKRALQSGLSADDVFNVWIALTPYLEAVGGESPLVAASLVDYGDAAPSTVPDEMSAARNLAFALGLGVRPTSESPDDSEDDVPFIALQTSDRPEQPESESTLRWPLRVASGSAAGRNETTPDAPATQTRELARAGMLAAEARSRLRAGDIDHAIELFDERHRLVEKVLSPSHPESISSRKDLADVCLEGGQLALALRLFHKNLTLAEAMLGSENADTILTRRDLAEAYRVAGNLEAAVSLHGENLAIAMRSYGSDRVRTLESREMLAHAVATAGDLDQAIALLRHNLRVIERALGTQTPEAIAARSILARWWLERGEFEFAIQGLQSNLSANERLHGATHADTRASRNALADAYHRAGDHDKAMALSRRNNRAAEKKAFSSLSSLRVDGGQFGVELSGEVLAIRGGRPLAGRVEVKGAKNLATKAMVAALLGESPSVLRDVPEISDVQVVRSLLEVHGVTVVDGDEEGSLVLDPSGAVSAHFEEIDPYAGASRIPILFCGPLLHLLGEALIPDLGGCRIGERPINFHMDALRAFGAIVDKTYEGIRITAPKGLHGANIELPYPSVGATEQVLLTAVRAKGVTELRNAAIEPEIMDLIAVLQKMGAIISYEPNRVILIEGVDRLRGYDHRCIFDRLEAGAWACAALATDGEIFVGGARQEGMLAFLNVFRRAGGEFDVHEDGILFRRSGALKSVVVETDVHPGFMTDWQQPLIVALTQAEGTSVVHETVYENRLGFTAALNQMGADIVVHPAGLNTTGRRVPRRVLEQAAVINGPTPLYGADVVVPDLRGGYSYVIAALAAQGESIVRNVGIIRRGYEKFFTKLDALGADFDVIG